MTTPKNEIDTSTNNAADYAAITLKGIAGAVPFAGSLIAEIIGNVIPNQRVDRIDRYLHILAVKVSAIEAELLENKLRRPEFIDLFEASLYQAVRAVSQERIKYIASLVSNSLADEQVDYIRYKHVLSLLDEINDVEVLLLQYHSLVLSSDGGKAFWENHKAVLSSPPMVTGSSQETVDKSIVSTSYREHLVRLSLLKPRFKKPKKGEMPEFDDKTGMFKAQGYEIASLGRLLLRYIDVDFSIEKLEPPD